MLDLSLLGTGGMMPLPNRYLTSLMTRLNGHVLLIDCGEATQLAIKRFGFGFKNIDILCITHFHADHISGLPGALLTMGNSDRTEPLTIIGPRGITNVVKSLRIIAPELPFETKCIEILDDEEEFFLFGYRIKAFKLAHNVPCYGYSVNIDRVGKFNLEKAMALDIPRNYWRKLQNGETVEYNNQIYLPEMVLGEDRSGIKVTYCTDTRPTESIVNNAKDSNLFICEGMYGDNSMAYKAKKYKHMTMQEACKLALDANVERLWLTHYSPSVNKPAIYEKELKKIFPNVVMGYDGISDCIKFID